MSSDGEKSPGVRVRASITQALCAHAPRFACGSSHASHAHEQAELYGSAIVKKKLVNFERLDCTSSYRITMLRTRPFSTSSSTMCATQKCCLPGCCGMFTHEDTRAFVCLWKSERGELINLKNPSVRHSLFTSTRSGLLSSSHICSLHVCLCRYELGQFGFF